MLIRRPPRSTVIAYLFESQADVLTPANSQMTQTCSSQFLRARRANRQRGVA